MTAFRKHDRVRALESGPSTVGQGTALVAGQIYTVHAVEPGGRIDIAEDEIMWTPSLFKLAERAVAEDKNGKPLYVGDEVLWGHVNPTDALVRGGSTEDEEVLVVSEGREYGIPRANITLARHHWASPIPAPEPPAKAEDPDAKLRASVQRFGETFEEYRKSEVERVAAAVDALNAAFQKVVQTARDTEPGWLPMEAKGTDIRFQYRREGAVMRIRVHPDDADRTLVSFEVSTGG